MTWFNYYGLIFTAVILIPNIVYAVKNKNESAGEYDNKAAIVFEQIGRYACMFFMTFNLPYTWIGFWFPFAQTVYLVVNGVLVAAYCVLWVIFWKKKGMSKAVFLSAIPSLVFLFSGVMLGSVPLAIFAVVFAVSHILISVMNARTERSKNN